MDLQAIGSEKPGAGLCPYYFSRSTYSPSTITRASRTEHDVELRQHHLETCRGAQLGRRRSARHQRGDQAGGAGSLALSCSGVQTLAFSRIVG